MKRHSYLGLAAVCLSVLAILVLAGCSGSTSTGTSTPASTSSGGGAAASGTTITEQNFAFSPTTATVKAGDTVTFTNNDSVAHNVKIDGKELGVQQPGESKTWTAPKDGSYPYSCIIHPSMTGQITVGAGGGATAPTGGTGGGSAPPAGTGY
jgi:plastocyanin